MTPFVLLLACSGSPDGLSRSDITGLRVVPESATLATREGEPGSARFRAYAVDVTGANIPLDLVSWDSTNLSAGSIDDEGRFTAVDTNGGVTQVIASYLGLESTSEVAVEYRDDVLVDDLEEALVDAFADAEPVEDPSLVLSYPPDQVRVPRNLEGLLFDWDSPGEGHVSRLRMQTEITDISIYVEGHQWTSSSALLETVSATNRGGAVTVSLEAGIWDGETLTDVVFGPAITVYVNRLDAKGSVFLWATNVGAIERIRFGSTTGERYWPPDDGSGSSDAPCVGCHVFNGASETMVVTHDGIDGVFTVVDVADVEEPQVVYSTETQPDTLTFKDISPDGEWIVGCSLGELKVWQLRSGKLHEIHDVGGPYSHPAFAPDGKGLAAVRATDWFNNSMAFGGGEIVELAWNEGELGEATVIVPASPTYSYYYPVYSPDGEWIAFNRSTGDSRGDEDAELMIVARDGSRMRLLERANSGPDLQNSYPRWAPLSDDDVMWLAFSSRRLYAGQDVPMPNVWVSAIDAAAAEVGQDPSSPAFWLPGQDHGTDNHLAVWWEE